MGRISLLGFSYDDMPCMGLLPWSSACADVALLLVKSGCCTVVVDFPLSQLHHQRSKQVLHKQLFRPERTTLICTVTVWSCLLWYVILYPGL